MFALALASYTSLHPVLLLPPLTLLCYDRVVSKPRQRSTTKGEPSASACVLRQLATFIVFLSILFGLSHMIAGSWSFIPSVYGTRLLLPDLTPNVGLWWYFFIEMFDPFRTFFLGVFWLHMASYSPGLTIRLRTQPLAATVLLCGVFAVFQPYANIGDAGAFMAMLTLYGHVLECMLQPFLRFPGLLTISSDTIRFHRYEQSTVQHTVRPCILLPLDICWKWQRKFLLRDYPRLEFGLVGDTGGCALCDTPR